MKAGTFVRIKATSVPKVNIALAGKKLLLRTQPAQAKTRKGVSVECPKGGWYCVQKRHLELWAEGESLKIEWK